MSQVDNSQRTTKIEPQPAGYPDLELHEEKLLIIVKTAPNPSDKYRETVCTVGITKTGKLIRLYPLPFRYMDFYKRFNKYQWITANIKKRPFEKDFRVDSYEPTIESIKPLGKQLPPGKWIERKKIVLPLASKNMEEIKVVYDNTKISLGIFKPKNIKKFIIEEGSKEWSQKHQRVLSQQRLFDQQPKELEKIPYKFSYEFVCNNEDCKGHTMQIIDWEINELYRNIREKYPFSPDIILEKVKNRWFNDMWGENKDSYLIVGSVYPKPTFVVLGVFWPPKMIGID